MKKIVCLFFFGLFASSVNAAIIKNLDFTGTSLPSSEADITFSNNTGNSESSLYSINSGFLEQRTFSVNGNASYLSPNSTHLGGSFDASLTTVIEARLKVLNIDGNGSYFQAFDGNNRYTAMLSPTGVNLITTSGNQLFTVDVFNFHTYRLESVGNSDILNLFIDDSLVGSVNAATNSLNGFGFGDGMTASGNGADVDWDYISVSQVSSVPAPAALWLFGSGLIGFLGVRRKSVKLSGKHA